MTERSWDRLVEEGREVVASMMRDKWRLGDLALEAVPPSKNGAHDDGRLAEYAQAIGEKPGTIREYRRVSAAWPAARRLAGTSWSVHQELAGRDDRFERIFPGLTVDEARRMRGAQPTRHAPPPRNTQEKAEHVRELLEDEDVATAVAADPKVRSSFAKATDNVMDQTRERQRGSIPEIADHEDDLAVLNTLRSFTRFRRDLRDAMDELKAERLSDEDREALEDAAERTAAALDLFATTVRSEEWDRALAQLVEGGDA